MATEQKNITQDLDEIKNSNFKELFIIFSLLVASFISIFGIYNVFGFSLIDFMNGISVPSEKYANYALLTLFSVTMFIMSTIYWKRKDFISKMQVIGTLTLILIIMIGIMALWVNNFIYPLVSLIILGVLFFLFNMLFDTIGMVGVFFSVSIFSVIFVFILKNSSDVNTHTIITIVQVFLSLLLFLGITYPRIRSTLFRIGTRDNLELSSNSDNSGVEEGED